MLIDVNKWIDKNGSFDEAGGLDLVRHGYEWIRRMRKFENKADRHTFQKVFGNKRGNELWDCFLEVGRSIFILEDSYFLINDRNVFSLCLAECSDYNEQGDYLFILNTNGEYLTSFHASWKKGRGVVIPRKAHADCNNIEKYRLATEDERQKFIDALKTSKEPKAKMYLKQFFGIEIEPEYKFKPFDKVLVRDTEDDDWHVSLFVREIADAQYKEERYECLNGTGWIYCIPYEGNEHFL